MAAAKMQYRANVKNEATAECPWFIYVETGFGSVYACRFETIDSAMAVADEMNDRWRAEGRLYVYVDRD